MAFELGELRFVTGDVLVEADDPVLDLPALVAVGASADRSELVEVLVGPVEPRARLVAVALLAPMGVGQVSEGA